MHKLTLTSFFTALLAIGIQSLATAALPQTDDAGPHLSEQEGVAPSEIVMDEVVMDLPELDTSMPAMTTEPNTAQSQKGLTITTTKLAMPMHQVGGSVSVITRPQIQQMQPTSLLEVLRQVPGVDTIQNGGAGGTSSVFIRGTNPEHVLIMVDGIRMNDPVAPGRTFNYLDQINPDAVERVEVLRGPQGPLYGSESIGGVINIITREGEGKPTLSAKITAGSYGTLQENISAGGQYGKIKGYINASRQDIRGFSAASSRYGNREQDGFHNTNILSKLQFQPLENLTLDVMSNYTQARFDLDNFGGHFGDDPNYTGKSRIFTVGGGSRLRLFNNRVEQITRLSLMDQERDFRNDIDIAHPFDTERSTYSSQLLNLDVINHLHLHETNTLTVGLNLQHEKGDSTFDSTFESQGMRGSFSSNFQNRSATNLAFYLQDTIKLWDRWFTTLGMRSDHHNRFGHYNTYRAASTFIIKETGTSLKASYGTGFKAPTLYQLYSSFGDPELHPETSIGWDAGIEQNLFENRIQLGATYFQNKLKNLIQFNPAFMYENIAHARTQGIEAFVVSQPFKNLLIRTSYTYTDTKDLSAGSAYQGDPLLRRPRNKISLNMNYRPIQKLNINLDVSRIGQRNDLDFNTFPASEVKLAAFTLVNLALSYDITRHINIFGRLVNILDQPYEMVKGYGTPRFSAYGGLRFNI